MRSRKKIIISAISLALCVLVTFAWINELQNPSANVLSLKFEPATVGDSELTVSLFEVNEEESTAGDDKNIPITDYIDDGETKTQTNYDNFAPGSRKKFRVDITNSSNASVRLRVILSDIICDNEDLRECVVIGTNGFDGFNSYYPAPMVQNEMLSNGMDESGRFVLIDSVEIPPHVEGEFVSIYFYVMFSASGRENLENLSFSIGKINFLTL